MSSGNSLKWGLQFLSSGSFRRRSSWRLNHSFNFLGLVFILCFMYFSVPHMDHIPSFYHELIRIVNKRIQTELQVRFFWRNNFLFHPLLESRHVWFLAMVSNEIHFEWLFCGECWMSSWGWPRVLNLSPVFILPSKMRHKVSDQSMWRKQQLSDVHLTSVGFYFRSRNICIPLMLAQKFPWNDV